MASHSDLVSITKVLLNVVQSTGKHSSPTCEQQDATGSSSSENTSLERGEGLSQPTLEAAMLGFSAIVKENVKDLKDFLSNRLSKNTSTLEEVKLKLEELEQKLTLPEMKGIEEHSTDIEEGFISKEATLPQHFDGICKGKNVLLTNASKTAERIRKPNDTGKHGEVISNFPLKEEDVFQIIIEETTNVYEKYGIAFGVISDKNAEIEGATNVYEDIKGTWAICTELDSTTGKSDLYKDKNITDENAYPLDTRNLTVGTVLGVKLRSNGDLHFHLNGVDKGIAFQNVPNNVFAFVDILCNVTKISIV